MSQNILLEMNGIHKRFHGVHALKGVHFDLRLGEVHALMGENGAGKSTLMKVLCGIHKRDEGDVVLFGQHVSFNNIKESQVAGISMIHQELNMMNHLTVAQNIYIGREPMKGPYIDDKKMEQDAAELFKRIGVKIDPSATLSAGLWMSFFAVLGLLLFANAFDDYRKEQEEQGRSQKNRF